MKPCIYNAFLEICDRCPNMDTKISTAYENGKPYMIKVDCTHRGECSRAYDMGRKEAPGGNEKHDI